MTLFQSPNDNKPQNFAHILFCLPRVLFPILYEIKPFCVRRLFLTSPFQLKFPCYTLIPCISPSLHCSQCVCVGWGVVCGGWPGFSLYLFTTLECTLPWQVGGAGLFCLVHPHIPSAWQQEVPIKYYRFVQWVNQQMKKDRGWCWPLSLAYIMGCGSAMGEEGRAPGHKDTHQYDCEPGHHLAFGGT